MPQKKYDKILVVNSGSSSLKFMLFSMANEKMVAKGLVERIGTPQANIVYQRDGESKIAQGIAAENHGKALAMCCKMLADSDVGVLRSLKEVNAIGHRVVHGAEEFSDSVIITEDVKSSIKDCSDLAPLHNPANLDGIVACETVFPNVPNVAVFDTAFHQSMPKHAFMYAIPQKYYEEYGIRKYGFHGTSHKFVAQAAADYLKRPLQELKLITCHLGNGSSIAAINGGKVLDTTMGMTPLPGMIMGTRCGDIDPAIIFFLARKGMSIDEIDNMLNKQSGLTGINGIGSGDMRDTVNAAAQGKASAENALNMFGHRAALYIGGYYTLLGGADAIIFTGGIGENSIPARKSIISRLEAIGCELDDFKNKAQPGSISVISTDKSKTPAVIIPTNEELMIARETFRLLSSKMKKKGE
ncbi:MAG: acetate kinase [Kiritimatiellae bacterium]|nr:acetate kinase [Kiritimatiellia bacterium]MDD3546255.1 acetate kinase [Kiritimatiellia bacterium]MDD4026252.1 acetate kinase [Kiritimatiellia bacterium]MDD4621766.1 acetate kinase [Kiritimatiellia bacterium]